MTLWTFSVPCSLKHAFSIHTEGARRHKPCFHCQTRNIPRPPCLGRREVAGVSTRHCIAVLLSSSSAKKCHSVLFRQLGSVHAGCSCQSKCFPLLDTPFVSSLVLSQLVYSKLSSSSQMMSRFAALIYLSGGWRTCLSNVPATVINFPQKIVRVQFSLARSSLLKHRSGAFEGTFMHFRTVRFLRFSRKTPQTATRRHRLPALSHAFRLFDLQILSRGHEDRV